MEVCRLCLDLLHGNNFSQLDATLKDVINIVAPEVNFEISSNPVLCKQCSSSIVELSKFKAKIIENEQRIRQKCNGECGDKLSLKEILYGVNLGEIVLTEKAKERICRTCLDSIECESFTVLKPSKPDPYLDSMVTMCLPELDLELSRDPVMCEKCLGFLQKFHHLKTSCLDIEEKIKNYCTIHGTNSSAQINLHSVLEPLVDDKNDHPEYVSLKTEIKAEKMDDVEMNDREETKTGNDKSHARLDNIKQENMEIKTEERHYLLSEATYKLQTVFVLIPKKVLVIQLVQGVVYKSLKHLAPRGSHELLNNDNDDETQSPVWPKDIKETMLMQENQTSSPKTNDLSQPRYQDNSTEIPDSPRLTRSRRKPKYLEDYIEN